MAFANLANAQYQIKIKAINTLDTVIYFRGTVFDEKNFIPKDTINYEKGIYYIAYVFSSGSCKGPDQYNACTS